MCTGVLGKERKKGVRTGITLNSDGDRGEKLKNPKKWWALGSCWRPKARRCGRYMV